MWERFTERAKHIVSTAREEAMRLGNEFVRTEHLLLGICHERQSLAARTLENLHVSIDALVAEIEKHVKRGEYTFGSDDIAFSPRAKRILEIAVEVSRRNHDGYIGSEHLLVALVEEGESPAARVLNECGVKFENASRVVETLVNDRPLTHPSGFNKGRRLLGHLHFSKRAELLFEIALETARSQDKKCFHTQHILLAMAADPDCVATQTLAYLGIKPSQLRVIAQQYLTEPNALPPKRWLPFAADSFQIFSYAVEEAEAEDRKHVGTEHILLGLLRYTDSEIVQQLAALGADYDSVRAFLNEDTRDSEDPRDSSPAT